MDNQGIRRLYIVLCLISILPLAYGIYSLNNVVYNIKELNEHIVSKEMGEKQISEFTRDIMKHETAICTYNKKYFDVSCDKPWISYDESVLKSFGPEYIPIHGSVAIEDLKSRIEQSRKDVAFINSFVLMYRQEKARHTDYVLYCLAALTLLHVIIPVSLYTTIWIKTGAGQKEYFLGIYKYALLTIMGFFLRAKKTQE